jgi:hypothetical protein
MAGNEITVDSIGPASPRSQQTVQKYAIQGARASPAGYRSVLNASAVAGRRTSPR